jgi:hypothetical protein
MVDDSEQACITWKMVRSVVLQMHQLWTTGVDSKWGEGGEFLINLHSTEVGIEMFGHGLWKT